MASAKAPFAMPRRLATIQPARNPPAIPPGMPSPPCQTYSADDRVVEVGLRARDDVVDPRPDDAERHGDRGDVGDDAPRAAAGDPPALAEDDREDDAGDDRQGVRAQRDRPELPHALRRAGQVGEVGTAPD